MNPKSWGEGEKFILNNCIKSKSMWEREAAESLGREGTLQGPQGTPSSKTIKSVQIILESLQRLNETLSYENANCITQLQHEGMQVIYTASTFSHWDFSAAVAAGFIICHLQFSHLSSLISSASGKCCYFNLACFHAAVKKTVLYFSLWLASTSWVDKQFTIEHGAEEGIWSLHSCH